MDDIKSAIIAGKKQKVGSMFISSKKIDSSPAK